MNEFVRPLGDRILCRVLTKEDGKSKGGIYIPDSAKERPTKALVLAVGPGLIENNQRIPVDVHPGEHVLFGKYSGSFIEHDGEELLILRETDILAVTS